MLITCWSSKGGAGTTVVAAALGAPGRRPRRRAARCSPTSPATLPAVLGLPEPAGPGLAGGSRAGPRCRSTRSGRLEVPAAPGLAPPRPRARAGSTTGRADVLAALARGRRPHRGRRTAARRRGRGARRWPRPAERSLLVTRPCFLVAPAGAGRAAAPHGGRAGRRAEPLAHPRTTWPRRSACPVVAVVRDRPCGGAGGRRRAAGLPPPPGPRPGAARCRVTGGALVDAIHAELARPRPGPRRATRGRWRRPCGATTRCSARTTSRGVAGAVTARAVGPGAARSAARTTPRSPR